MEVAAILAIILLDYADFALVGLPIGPRKLHAMCFARLQGWWSFGSSQWVQYSTVGTVHGTVQVSGYSTVQVSGYPALCASTCEQDSAGTCVNQAMHPTSVTTQAPCGPGLVMCVHCLRLAAATVTAGYNVYC